MPMVFLDNFCLTLTHSITSAQTLLPVSASDKSKICSLLGTNFTYLSLSTPMGSEIFKVECVDGQVVAQRAQGGTVAIPAAKGTCLCFKVNKLVLDNYLPQGYCEVTITTDTPDFIEIVAPTDPNCNWKVNIKQSFIDKFNECCLEDTCNNCTIADGVYENAKITVINGKVCAVSNGTNIVYSSGGCCGCSN